MKVLLFGGNKGIGKAIKDKLTYADPQFQGHEVVSISRSEKTWPLVDRDVEYDVFIYCSGMGRFNNEGKTIGSILDMVQVNLQAPMIFAFDVKAKHYIFIASNSAYYGFEGSEVYCATKHGILGFARALRKSGKKVSVVSPGTTNTDFWKDSGRQMPELYMEPEDVADAVMACINNKACIEELLIMPQRKEE